MIAVYELFSAACAALLAYRLVTASSQAATGALAIVCISFALLAALTGGLLWYDRPLGYRLGVIGESLRVVRFATPWLSYYAFFGLDLNLGLQYFAHGIAGIGPDAHGGGLWLQWFVIAIVQFAVAREPPFWGVGVNVVGVLVLWSLRRAQRQARLVFELPEQSSSNAAAG